MQSIPNFEEYAATENGEIYRVSYKDCQNTALHKLPHKLSPKVDRYGYEKVVLSVNGKCHYKTVHRLVAETFIQNPLSLPFVNHKDGNKRNNHVKNLEWGTPKENVLHAHKTGLHKGVRTAVTLYNDNSTMTFSSVEKAAQFLGHSRDCFRRHLTFDSNHGCIDGWNFQLTGGKCRREVVTV